MQSAPKIRAESTDDSIYFFAAGRTDTVNGNSAGPLFYQIYFYHAMVVVVSALMIICTNIRKTTSLQVV